MVEDLLEKGAIVQRDKETYAVAPHIPGGIITDFNLLRRIAWRKNTGLRPSS